MACHVAEKLSKDEPLTLAWLRAMHTATKSEVALNELRLRRRSIINLGR